MVATQAAYEKGEDWLQAMNNYLDDNFNYLADFLEKNCRMQNLKFQRRRI